MWAHSPGTPQLHCWGPRPGHCTSTWPVPPLGPDTRGAGLLQQDTAARLQAELRPKASEGKAPWKARVALGSASRLQAAKDPCELVEWCAVWMKHTLCCSRYKNLGSVSY